MTILQQGKLPEPKVSGKTDPLVNTTSQVPSM